MLPFSQESDTGDCVLVRGMGLNVLCSPLHKAILSCDLVDGDVHIGVRPALPIDGVDVILGNDLAGNRVWADGCPPVKSTPLLKEPVDCEQEFPDVFTACAVMRAMTRDQSALDTVQKEECDLEVLHVTGSLSISQQELQ